VVHIHNERAMETVAVTARDVDSKRYGSAGRPDVSAASRWRATGLYGTRVEGFWHLPTRKLHAWVTTCNQTEHAAHLQPDDDLRPGLILQWCRFSSASGTLRRSMRCLSL
jgi:hypothetical protein